MVSMQLKWQGIGEYFRTYYSWKMLPQISSIYCQTPSLPIVTGGEDGNAVFILILSMLWIVLYHNLVIPLNTYGSPIKKTFKGSGIQHQQAVKIHSVSKSLARQVVLDILQVFGAPRFESLSTHKE